LTGGDGWASLIITASEAVTVTHRKGVDNAKVDSFLH
jgi:hypothetical protein